MEEILQQEAQKFSPWDGEPTIEITATAVTSTYDNSSIPLEAPVNAKDSNLEATVKELREALEKSRKNEAALQQEIINLQSALSEQKELSEKLKKEVEDAKNAAIYLAQANSQLTEQVKVNASKPEVVSKPATVSKPEIVSKPATVSKPEIVPKPGKDTFQSAARYKKSYSTPTYTPKKMPENSAGESAENTNSQMWLLD